MKKSKRIRRMFKSLLVFSLAMAMSFSTMTSVSAQPPDVTLIITALGLADGIEAPITVEKEDDGVVMVVGEGTTVNHVAEISVPGGKGCNVIPGDVPGYTANESSVYVPLSEPKTVPVREANVSYTADDLPVVGVSLNKNDLKLLAGDSETLVATVSPANAGNQTVVWSSSDNAVATVVNGGVTAVGFGVATITAASQEDPDIKDECVVQVGTVVSVGDPAEIHADVAQVIALPSTLVADVSYPLDGSTTMAIAVSWAGASVENTVIYYAAGTYDVDGLAGGMPVAQHIIVSGEEVEAPDHWEITPSSGSLFLGGTIDLSLTNILPVGASTAGIMWGSSNESLATVAKTSDTTATVTANATNTGIVSIMAFDGNGNQSITTLSVGIDPAIVDPVRIVGTDEDSNEVEVYDSRQDVYISTYGLQPATTYNIKVESSGHGGAPLGIGTFTTPDVIEDPFVFNYWTTVGTFDLTDKNSQMYYVSVSTDPDFPEGDDEFGVPQTLVDNFKITSPIPTGSIDVTIEEILNGEYQNPISGNLLGKDVILARILDENNVLGTEYEDYLINGSTPNDPEYSDEVKLIGHIQANGSVAWDEPKEVLKIGGYLLFIQLPNGYQSNLNQINPDSEDGELLKEVHIQRNQNIIRVITVNNPDPTQVVEYLTTFETDGGVWPDSSTTMEITETLGALYVLPTTVPTRDGYTFGGWFTAPDDSGVEVTSGTLVTLQGHHHLYAHWAANHVEEAYDVTFNANGGAWADSSTTAVITQDGDTYLLPETDPTMPGYVFMGWFPEADGSGTEVTASTIVELEDDQTLYAHFEEMVHVTFIYLSNDNEWGTVDPTTESVNPEIGTPTGSVATALDGYHFVEWVDEQGATVSTEATFVPSKGADELYESATYVAMFAKDEVTPEPTDGTVVGTGDETPIAMYAALTGISLLGILVALKRKSQEKM